MHRVILPNNIILPEVERLLDEDKHVTIRVKGNSMLPFIRGGQDSVELRKPHSLKERDIVLARLADGRYVIHRIVKLTDSGVLLMGDGNLYGREKCDRTDIIAEVFRIFRGGKSIHCNGGSERVFAKIWMMLLPVRRYLLAICRRVN